MKKTLIALAVAAVAATSANATVVYQKDGTKIDIDGRLHFELINEKNNRTDLRDVGSRLRVRAYQEIGAGFSAFGGVELRFSKTKSEEVGLTDAIGGNFRTHRLFAGVMHKDIGSLTFGRQLHLGDHIPKANPTYEWGGNIFFDGHTKAAHFMSAKFAGVRVAADYYFGDSYKQKADKSYKAKNDQGYGFGAFYDGQWGKFSVNLDAGYTEVKNSDGTRENQYKLKRGGIGSKFTYDKRYQIPSTSVYPHSFRHRFAKSFLNRLNDISLLADLLGHENIQTTRIYLRRTNEEQKALINKIVDW